MVAKDVLNELSAIRAEVNALNGRLDRLERSATTPAGHIVRVSPTSRSLPTAISHRLDAYEAGVDHKEHKTAVDDIVPDIAPETPQDASQNASQDIHQNVAKNTSQDMETKIGTFWLNRIGIGSLVLGVVFLILYSFQYFGVTAKLIVGYLVSTALVFGGERISKQAGRDWYGNALIGGGWSLMYFTAYAMHFIPALKVIDSFAAELFILCGIAASAMRHAVYKKSEPLAIIATVLGVVAIAFGKPSHLSYIGYMAITAGAALIAVSQKWIKVFYVALLTCYSAHFCTSVALGLPSGHLGMTNTVWSLAALFPSWFVFNTALSNFAKQKGMSEHLLIFTSLNAVYLTGAIFLFAQGSLTSWIYLLLAAASCCYLISAHFMNKQQLTLLADTHSLFGLSILTMALGNKFDGEPRLMAYLGEAIAIALLHLRNKNQIYGWFAPALFLAAYIEWLYKSAECASRLSSTVVWMGVTSPILCVLGLAAVAACCALAWQHRKVPNPPEIYQEKKFATQKAALHNAYIILANIFGLSIPAILSSSDGQALFWFSLTFINSMLYERTEKPIFQVFTNIALLATVITTVNFSCIEVTANSFAITGLMFMLDWSSSKSTQKYKSSLRVFAQAALILALTLVFQLPAQTISVGLGGLGLACLIMGFAARVKVYRAWGLFSLGLLSCRLVFVDLAHENTIERIIAFTVSGAILLLGSYAYAKFADNQSSKTTVS
jgi:uncharacterized membrane protein